MVFGFRPHCSAVMAVIGLNVEPGATEAMVALLYSGAGAITSRGFSDCTDFHALVVIPSEKIFGS